MTQIFEAIATFVSSRFAMGYAPAALTKITIFPIAVKLFLTIFIDPKLWDLLPNLRNYSMVVCGIGYLK